MIWTITITGCGTSHGSPPWGVPKYWSDDPKDLRRRSGALLRGPEGQVILLDCGPDLMHQMRDPLRTWDGRGYPADCIVRCDGVLLTHDHADHCHGINDLRHLNRLMRGSGIAMYGHAKHLDEVRAMFPFCFGGGVDFYHLSKPALTTVAVDDGTPFTVAGLTVTPCELHHGPAGRVTGFRFGSCAYLTDLKSLPESSDRHLLGLDLLVMSALRDQLHETHQNWDEAMAVIARLRPRRTVLTHLGYEVRHADWTAKAPAGVEIAYDGWTGSFHA